MEFLEDGDLMSLVLSGAIYSNIEDLVMTRLEIGDEKLYGRKRRLYYRLRNGGRVTIKVYDSEISSMNQAPDKIFYP